MNATSIAIITLTEYTLFSITKLYSEYIFVQLLTNFYDIITSVLQHCTAVGVHLVFIIINSNKKINALSNYINIQVVLDN